MSVSFFPTILPFQPKVISRVSEVYADIEVSIEEKIILEKRRRNYLYKNLDYLLSTLTYFDFFSLDSFEILKTSREISSFYKIEKINLDVFFLSFFYSSFELSFLLEEAGLNKEGITEILEENFKEVDLSNPKLPSFFKNIKNIFGKPKKQKNQNQMKGLEKNKVISNLSLSSEVVLFLEKASENALNRFKTPVLTAEILFLTLLEEKNNFYSKIIQNIINDDLKWELLKYKIIKRIHREESALRDQVSKNQYYFAYLLKTQLTDNQFNQLINAEELEKGVELFRNTLMTQLLEIDLFKLVEIDVYKSMKITNTRKYSS